MKNLEQLQRAHQIYLESTGLAFQDFLRTSQVEKVFGLNTNEIRRLVKKGLLTPNTRPKGRVWYFKSDDVARLLPNLNSNEEERLTLAIHKLQSGN